MRRYSPRRRQMFPERIRRIAVKNHTWRARYEQRQKVAEDFGRNCYNTERRQKCAEDVSVTKRIGKSQLCEDTGGKTQIDSDRQNMSASHASAGADDQLFRFQTLRESLHYRIYNRSPRIHN